VPYATVVKRRLLRLADRIYVLVTASAADGKHYWKMRRDQKLSQRQPPVPVATARWISERGTQLGNALVFGSTGAAVSLVDLSCRVTHIESDPGRAFAAEFLLSPEQRPLLNSVVIDRRNADGRQAYINAMSTHGSGAKLIIVGGKAKADVVAAVLGVAPAGAHVVVVRGGRDKYHPLRAALREANRDFSSEWGPSADGSARRTSALVVDV
jgi:hypothetical protein